MKAQPRAFAPGGLQRPHHRPGADLRLVFPVVVEDDLDPLRLLRERLDPRHHVGQLRLAYQSSNRSGEDDKPLRFQVSALRPCNRTMASREFVTAQTSGTLMAKPGNWIA